LHINSYTRISRIFAKRNEITLENQIDREIAVQKRADQQESAGDAIDGEQNNFHRPSVLQELEKIFLR